MRASGSASKFEKGRQTNVYQSIFVSLQNPTFDPSMDLIP